MNIPVKFRFKTLHRVRKLEEKTKLRELGALIHELEKLTLAKRLLLEKQDHTRRRLSTASAGKHQVGLAQNGVQWMLFLSEKVEKIDFQIEDMHALIQKKKKEVSVAHRQRKMFDKLKEKHEKKLEIDGRRQEENILNDVAVTRYVKGNNEQMAPTGVAK